MIPDWAKNLLVKIVVGTALLLALTISVGTVAASDIQVNPSSIVIPFSFDQPKESAHYETTRTFTIQNINPNPNSTISGDIGSFSGAISITPNYDSFSLHGGESLTVTLKIVAEPSASEGTQVFTLEVGEESLTVTVTVTYYAKIELSPQSIDFGQVHRTDNPSKTVRISEKYGYKDVNLQITLLSGNSWVTGLNSTLIPAGAYKDITFQLNPGDPDRNDYSWTFSLSTTTSNTKISPSSILIEAYLLMPAKLGRLYDEELKITFDKPKGTVWQYDQYINVRVRNEGDETLYFTSELTEDSNEIAISIDNPSGSVSGKSSKDIRLRIRIPYDAPEGTYRGELEIEAGDAGSGRVELTIEIKWPVDFIITPASVDFGSLELNGQEYENRSVNITLTEFYLYKPVRNLRITKSGEYGNWLDEEIDFATIPTGKSRNFTLTIEPGLEAVPRDYLWEYRISASEIGTKRMNVKAKIVPLNISMMMEGLRLFLGTPLHQEYPSSEAIIVNGVGLLVVVEGTEISAEDWEKIPVLMYGTLSLLSSLNEGIIASQEENYGEAVENLVAASVSTSTITSNAQLSNAVISTWGKDISAGAERTTAEVLRDEANKLELRGWNIKKAVEHALAMDDISVLKEEENLLEAALSYQYAATLYGLLSDQEKRVENSYEAALLMDKHDDSVSDAIDLRIRAETSISMVKENDFSKLWDSYFLVNPYNYDSFSESYETAERYLEEAVMKYKVAGELLMYEETQEELQILKSERRFILSMFFLVCIVYGGGFLYATIRIFGGTMAYLRDMHEREAGDILVT
jgi:hypothetical protein